jgi:ubiquinone/menaquinone biosynthesis C-methylase UbiE
LEGTKETGRLFDEWPEKYDQWFTTPIGLLVKRYEWDLVADLLKPQRGERILDAGCGSGVFSVDLLSCGPKLTSLDISLPMLRRAGQKVKGFPCQMVLGDMLRLPFPENSFDKVVSITALEFIRDGKRAYEELSRVTKKRGSLVVATLNSLSPWAWRRKAEAERRPSIFAAAIFRSPDEVRALAPVPGVIRTAIHFQKDDDPDTAPAMEREGRQKDLDTGAFLIGRWEKP